MTIKASSGLAPGCTSRPDIRPQSLFRRAKTSRTRLPHGRRPYKSDMTEPEVSVPALMRNYHEVLRNDLSKVLTPLAEAGDLAGFSAAWKAYTRAIAVHAAMEDGVEGSGGGSAAMLDHYFDGAAGAATFRDEHVREHAVQSAVTDAIPNGADALRAAFAAYRVMAAAHLEHEEDIMMPLVARLPGPK